MKKYYVMVIVIALFAFKTQAQILTPVHWSYGAKRINATEAVVFLRATLDPGWHVYSQNVKDGGPVKTSFSFNPSKEYQIIGATIEPTPITRNEKVFGMDVSFFETSVIFQQKIRLKTKQTTVTGKLEYMTCNDRQCLPPEDIDFSIPVN
jgi:DsbC/DsbD-like thiol-disulfide interchange protein